MGILSWDYLREVNMLSIVLRLTLAVLFGGIIGLERGMKGHPAGLRTHILVCIGASLAMVTNQYIISSMGIEGDPSRLGAQVISGIGFLGAGTILVTGKQKIKGLTTAAGLWASACMGIAIGIGFYEGAFVACIYIFAVTTIMNKINSHVLSASRYIDIYLGISSMENFGEFLNHLRAQEFDILSIEVIDNRQLSSNGVTVLLTVRQTDRREHSEVLQELKILSGVTFIEAL